MWLISYSQLTRRLEPVANLVFTYIGHIIQDTVNSIFLCYAIDQEPCSPVLGTCLGCVLNPELLDGRSTERTVSVPRSTEGKPPQKNARIECSAAI